MKAPSAGSVRYLDRSDTPEVISRRGRAPHEEGFTLIEVVVALGVFAVVSLATVSILVSSLRTVNENEDRVLAANLARSELEQARITGAIGIEPGLTVSEVNDFIVRRSASWVGVDQSVSPCEAISPGQDFLRVSVEVSGRTLAAPQRIDGVIPGVAPDDAAGSLTVFVGDRFADPLSDVTITGTDQFHARNNFSVVTGPDGCVFLPELDPSGSLQVQVQRRVDGIDYIARTPEGTRQQTAIDLDAVSRLNFTLARPAALRFESLAAAYPVPEGIEVSWKELTTGSVIRTTPLGTTVPGLWPASSGFEAWLGRCTDANPREYGSAPTSFDLTEAQTVNVPVEAARVRIRGLAPEGSVTLRYTGTDPECADLVVDAGAADETGRLSISLPYGSWEFSSDGQTQLLPEPLQPAPDRFVVTFTLDEPEPEDEPEDESQPGSEPLP